MGQLVFQATAGGQVALVGPNPSSNFSLNVPAVNGNLVTTGDTGTVTNTMLASNVYTAPGTIGSVTPNTGAFTNLSYTGTLTGGTGIVNLGSGQFYIDGSGNVGIGTSSPAAKLDVNPATGDATVRLKGGGAYLSLYSTTIGYSSINGGDNTTTRWRIGQIGFGGTDGMAFYTGASDTERMRIDSGGNLLVGGTSKLNSAMLSVYGQTASYGTSCRSGTGGTFSGNAFNINWTGNPILWIDSTNIGQIATVSDYRLKENVTPQTTALNRVMQLQPVKFNRKAVGIFGGSSDIEEGFLAHELQAIIPSAVTGDKDALTEAGTIQPQSLNWSPVVSVLVKAIQELNSKVDAQAAEIDTLKGIK